MTAAPVIAFRDVDLAFGDHLVLGKLTFEIRRGEIVCIVGSSGCGKTTALRVAAGLIPPGSGEDSFAARRSRGRVRPREDRGAAACAGATIRRASAAATAIRSATRSRRALSAKPA